MRRISLLVMFCLTLPFAAFTLGGENLVSNALSFKMKSIDGKEVDLSEYKGKVVLFVNVASKCGYTPQYEGLQKLYKTYEKEGLVVIGIPANEFGGSGTGHR